MNLRRIFMVFLIIFGVGVASTSQNLYGEEPYKIGFICATSGPASSLGGYQHRSVVMVEEEVNKAGGINGHPLKLITYDDQSDPAKGVLAAKRLIQTDKVCGILGPSTTPLTLPVAPVANEAKIPLISNGSAGTIVNPVRPYIFKSAPHGPIPYGIMVERFIKPRGIKKVAFLYESDAYGLEGKTALEYLAKDKNYGFEIVRSEAYKLTDTDITPILIKIKGIDAELLVVAGIPPGTSILAKNAKEIDLKIPILMDGGSTSQKYIDLAGKGAEGTFVPVYAIAVADQVPDTDPLKKLMLKYLKSYKDRWNEEGQPHGGFAYDGIQMFISGLKKVGPDPEKLKDHIENLKDFPGITGIFDFSPTDHTGRLPGRTAMYVCTVRDGKFVMPK